MKFRKKPLVVEAYQTDVRMLVKTLEGTMIASPGDWIITGIAGEQYPCNPHIFARTYEPLPAHAPITPAPAPAGRPCDSCGHIYVKLFCEHCATGRTPPLIRNSNENDTNSKV